MLTSRTPPSQTHGRLVAKAAEEERKRERRRRDAIDDLRYAVRKIEPPLPLDAPFDQVRLPFQHAPLASRELTRADGDSYFAGRKAHR